MAGDGYQATNERRLVVGLGEATHVDKVVVRWPSGVEQTFDDLPVDSEILFVENRQQFTLMPGLTLRPRAGGSE